MVHFIIRDLLARPWLALSGCSGLGSNLGMQSDKGEVSRAPHWQGIVDRLDSDQKMSVQEIINHCKS